MKSSDRKLIASVSIWPLFEVQEAVAAVAEEELLVGMASWRGVASGRDLGTGDSIVRE